MADRINSQKKLDYVKQSTEVLEIAKRDIQNSVETLRGLCDQTKMAVTDRAYNNIAYIGSVLLRAISTYANILAEDILTPLTTGPSISGEALKQGAKKLLPDVEALAAKELDLPQIAQATIDARGLEENWTDSTRNAFSNECLKFITIRERLMSEVSDITHKNVETDTKDTYMNIGREFERVCNEAVAAYNKLTEQLEEAGICLAEAIAQAENAGTKLKSSSNVGRVSSILGDDDAL